MGMTGDDEAEEGGGANQPSPSSSSMNATAEAEGATMMGADPTSTTATTSTLPPLASTHSAVSPATANVVVRNASDVNVDAHVDDKDDGGEEEDVESAVTARTAGSTTAHTRTSASVPALSACYSEEDETTVTTTPSLYHKYDGLKQMQLTMSKSQHSAASEARGAGAFGWTSHLSTYTSSRPYALATQFAQSGGNFQGGGNVVEDDDDAASVLSMGSFASSLPYHHPRRTRPSGMVSPQQWRKSRGSPGNRSASGSAAKPTSVSSAKTGQRNRLSISAASGGESSVAAASSASATTTGTVRESVYDRLYSDALAKSERQKQRERDKDSVHSPSNHSVSFYSARQQLSICSHAGPCEDYDDASSIEYEGNDSVFDRLYRNEKRCCRYRHRVSPKNVAPTSLERRLSYKPNFAGTTPNLQSPHWQQRLRDANTAAAVVAVPGKLAASPSVFERLYRNEPRAIPVLPPSALRPGPLHRRLSASPRQVKFGTPTTTTTTSPAAKGLGSSQQQPSPKPLPPPLERHDDSAGLFGTSTAAPRSSPKGEVPAKLDFESGYDIAAAMIQSQWGGSLRRREFLLRRQSSADVVQALPTGEAQAGLDFESGYDIAAAVIQSQWRGLLRRREFLLRWQSSAVAAHAPPTGEAHADLNFQSGYDIAATMIQSQWRGLVRRREFLRWQSCAVAVHALPTGEAQADLDFESGYGIAVSMIQSQWRGYLHRREFLRSQELQSFAATRIQAWWKALAATLTYFFTRMCAVSIQRAIRTHLSTVRLKNASATRVSANWRRCVEQRKYWTMMGRVMSIQTAWRQSGIAKQAKERRQSIQPQSFGEREACLRLQTWFRVLSASTSYRTQRRRLIILQSLFRGHQLRKRIDLQRSRRAAVMLQRRVRGYVARLHRDLSCQSGIRLQSLWRGHLSRTLARSKRVYSAATTIQCMARGSRDRSALTMARASAVLIQSLVRGRIQRFKFQRFMYSVRAVQARARRRRALCILQLMRRRECAAVRIQSCWRGAYSRCSFTLARAAAVTIQASLRARRDLKVYQALVRRRFFSAIVIQTEWRGCKCRAAFTLLKISATLIQSIARQRKDRIRYSRLLTCTLTVQKSWRIRQRRLVVVTRRQHAATAIQAIARQRIGAKQLRLLLSQDRKAKAATTIQSNWRSIKPRSELSLAVAATVMIQASFRGQRARLAFLSLCRSALIVQQHARRYLVKRELRLCKTAAISLQSSWRGSLARMHFTLACAAATILQSTVRGYQMRSNFTSLRQATVTVQSSWRCSVARSRFAISLCAATMIQAVVRGNFQRRLDSNASVAATRIQGAVRGVQAREEYCRQQGALIRLQSAARSTCRRRRYRDLRQAAIRIQVWRRYEVRRRRFAAATVLAVRLQALSRGAILRSRLRLQQESAAKIQYVFRSLAGVLAARRHRSFAARVIQLHWRTFTSRRLSVRLSKAARTIQLWYFSIQLRLQHSQLQSSAAVLSRCIVGSFRRDLVCFSLVRINRLLRKSALHTLTRLERQRGQSLAPPDVRREWNQVLDDAKHLAATVLQCVVRSYLCRRAICDETPGSPSRSPPRSRCPVAVRVLSSRPSGSVTIELCPILQEKRQRAARVLHRFFADRVRQEAREAQVRVETEWVAIRAERAATRLVQELTNKDCDMDGDGWRGLGHCIPRLARRARAAHDQFQEALQRRERVRDGKVEASNDY